MKTKRNAQDATLRNVKAANKKMRDHEKRIRELEKFVAKLKRAAK